MPRYTEMSGKTIGKWTVLKLSHIGENGFAYWKCKCSCGHVDAIMGRNLRVGQSFGCRSCGNKEHGKSKTPEYRSYISAKQRCIHKHNPSYPRYGGRGIEFRWESFPEFLSDMGKRPKGCSLERIDVNGPYCKENCKWASIQTQNINKRNYENNLSGVRGVYWNKQAKRWQAFIGMNGVKIHLGLFEELSDAAEKRKEAENKYFAPILKKGKQSTGEKVV